MSHYGRSLTFGVIVNIYMGKVAENQAKPARPWS
jgi:hypothetical protein